MNKKAKYTKVNEEQKNRIDKVRYVFSDVYDFIESICKSSREASLALTKLEEAQFWAIKGISRENYREDKEPILTDLERQYLGCALRPLSEVKSITKVPGIQFDFLKIAFIERDYMYSQRFEKGTMYQGMEYDKPYTPEELNLNLEEESWRNIAR